MKRSLGLAAGMAAVAWAGLAAGVLCAGAAQGWQDRVRPVPGEPPIGIPPMPAPASPLERIVGGTEALAVGDVPAARAFAWDLAQVLKAHAAAIEDAKVELPKPLRDLAAGPRPDPGRPTEANLQTIADQAQPIVQAAAEWGWDRPPECRCPPKFGVAVLRAMAAAGPSAALRMAAAQRLVQAALPDPEGKRIAATVREATPAAAAGAAKDALAYALSDVLAVRPSDDAARAIAVAVATSLDREYVLLAAVAGAEPSRAAVERLVDDLAAQVAAAQKAGHDGSAAYSLDLMARNLGALKKGAGQVAETAAMLAAADRLAERFLTAVNTENRAGALACLTPRTATVLAEARSLRAAFTGRDDARELVYLGLGPSGEVGQRRYVTLLYRVTDAAGGAATAAKEMGLAKADAGWRLGEPAESASRAAEEAAPAKQTPQPVGR